MGNVLMSLKTSGYFSYNVNPLACFIPLPCAITATLEAMRKDDSMPGQLAKVQCSNVWTTRG